MLFDKYTISLYLVIFILSFLSMFAFPGYTCQEGSKQVDLRGMGWTTKDDRAMEILWESLLKPPMSYCQDIEFLEKEDSTVKLSSKSSKEQLKEILKNRFAKYPENYYRLALYAICTAEDNSPTKAEKNISEGIDLRRRLHHKARSIKSLWQDYKVFWTAVKNEPKARNFWGLAYQRSQLVFNCGDKAVENAEALVGYNYSDLVSKLRKTGEIREVNERIIRKCWNPYRNGGEWIDWHESEEDAVPNFQFDTRFLENSKQAITQ